MVHSCFTFSAKKCFLPVLRKGSSVLPSVGTQVHNIKAHNESGHGFQTSVAELPDTDWIFIAYG